MKFFREAGCARLSKKFHRWIKQRHRGNPLKWREHDIWQSVMKIKAIIWQEDGVWCGS
jgi:hypothetical protein